MKSAGAFCLDCKRNSTQPLDKSTRKSPAFHLQQGRVITPCSLPPSLHLLLILIPWTQPKTWSAYMLPLRCSSSVLQVSYCLMIQYYRNITVEISCFISVSFSPDLSIISCIILYSYKASKSSNRYLQILTSIFPAERFVFCCHQIRTVPTLPQSSPIMALFQCTLLRLEVISFQNTPPILLSGEENHTLHFPHSLRLRVSDLWAKLSKFLAVRTRWQEKTPPSLLWWERHQYRTQWVKRKTSADESFPRISLQIL